MQKQTDDKIALEMVKAVQANFIQRFVKQWKVDNKKSSSAKQAFVPLSFPPGDVEITTKDSGTSRGHVYLA